MFRNLTFVWDSVTIQTVSRLRPNLHRYFFAYLNTFEAEFNRLIILINLFKEMAFVFRAERKIDLSGKDKGLNVGPGAYIGHKEYKPKPQV